MINKETVIALLEAEKISLSKAMVNALQKNTGINFKRVCDECGFLINSYRGAYPKTCTVCGGNIVKTESAEYMMFDDEKSYGTVKIDETYSILEFYYAISEAKLKEPYVVYDTADGNNVVGMASNEKGAKEIISTAELPPVSVKDKKTLKIIKTNKKQQGGYPLNEAKIDNFKKLKQLIIKSVSFTGKDKGDPDELEAMADIRDNSASYKDLVKTLKKDYNFDKKDFAELDKVVIDFQFGESANETTIESLYEAKKQAGEIGTDGDNNNMNMAIKINGIPSGYLNGSFGWRLGFIKKEMADFKKTAKTDHVGAKGKPTLQAVKKWIKDNKPTEFYATWQKDSSSYKDDSVKILYK